jgi:hypothetical protein
MLAERRPFSPISEWSDIGLSPISEYADSGLCPAMVSCKAGHR